MRLITGDECGLLKEFLPSAVKKKKDGEGTGVVVVVVKDGIRQINTKDRMSRANGLVDLAWMMQNQQSFAALRIDGSIETWEAKYEGTQSEQGVYQRIVKLPSVFGAAGDEDACLLPSSQNRALGMHALENNLLCACNTQGDIAVIKPFVETENVVQQFSAFGGQGNRQQKPAAVTAFAVQQNTAAVGGRDRETVLLDLDTAKQIWKAKNLPPDPQTLLQPPVWPTAACFMSGNDNILAVGTAHHQVRIYDIRLETAAGVLQRRPISYTPLDDSSFLEYRVTALCPLSKNELVVGDAAGYIHAIDIRQLHGSSSAIKQAAVLGRFVGPAGSVRKLVRHTTMDRMAAVGLDRMLRIYDTTTRKQLQSVYLKQRLNCVLVSDEEYLVEDDQNLDQEDDDVRDYVDSSDDDEGSIQDVDDVLEEIDAVDDDDVLPSSSSSEEESIDSGENEVQNSPRKRRRE